MYRAVLDPAAARNSPTPREAYRRAVMYVTSQRSLWKLQLTMIVDRIESQIHPLIRELRASVRHTLEGAAACARTP